MKFYRGLVDIGKTPVIHQVQRGFKPMTMNADGRHVQIANAAPINPMSAAEVVVLRHVFGGDAVTELYEVGERKTLSFAAERDRLENLYGEKVLREIFGVRGAAAKLPREVENIVPEPEPEPVEVQLSGGFDDDALDGPPAEEQKA
jgi:hypothetical protein